MSQTSTAKAKVTTIKTTVDYLPTDKAFHKRYAPETTLQVVRTEAMSHFGVADYTDRDRHEFHLEFKGSRVDYGQTLRQLIGARRRSVHLDLVEQVTAGGG